MSQSQEQETFSYWRYYPAIALSCLGDIRKIAVYQLFNMSLELKTSRNEQHTEFL